MPAANPNLPDAPVLILAPTGNDARNAMAVLDKAGIRSETCASIPDLCQRAGEHTGAMLVSEETLDLPSLNCLLEFLVRQPPWSDLPLVLLTTSGEIRHQTYSILNLLGTRANVTLLERPLRAITLISVISAALRSRNHQYEVQGLLKSYHQAMEGAQLATAKFRAVFEQSSVFAGVMTLEGIVMEANRLCLDVCGYHAEEVLGRPFWECGWWRGSTVVQEKLREGTKQAARGTLYAEELSYLWADGTERVMEFALYPIRDEAGQILFLHPTGVDITERKRADKALREANALLADKAGHLEVLVQQRAQRLRETIGELEAFSYSIAHDMRAPLRSLQGFSDILLTHYGSKLEPDCQRFLQLIAESASRMDKLILDVLSYSQVVRIELPLNPVNVEQLLHGIVNTYPIFAPDKADIVIEGPFPTVLGNEAMLTQIFSNLMGNAVKFVSPGVKPRIRVWAESRDRRAQLFVRDNGIGIEPDQHDKIFAIFQRVNKDFEGTGIGLSIVKKAVERMGGTVGLESAPGRGSIFRIELNRTSIAGSKT